MGPGHETGWRVSSPRSLSFPVCWVVGSTWARRGGGGGPGAQLTGSRVSSALQRHIAAGRTDKKCSRQPPSPLLNPTLRFQRTQRGGEGQEEEESTPHQQHSPLWTWRHSLPVIELLREQYRIDRIAGRTDIQTGPQPRPGILLATST